MISSRDFFLLTTILTDADFFRLITFVVQSVIISSGYLMFGQVTKLFNRRRLGKILVLSVLGFGINFLLFRLMCLLSAVWLSFIVVSLLMIVLFYFYFAHEIASAKSKKILASFWYGVLVNPFWYYLFLS